MNPLLPGWAEKMRSVMTSSAKRLLAEHAPGLTAHLTVQGYRPDTVARHVRLLAHLDRCLEAEDLAPDQLTAQLIERFVQSRRANRHAVWPSHRGLAPLLGYLREIGVVPTSVEVAGASTIERMLASYRHHLIAERVLVETTVRRHEYHARLFFSELTESVRSDPTRLSARDVIAVTRSQCRSHSVGYAQYR